MFPQVIKAAFWEWAATRFDWINVVNLMCPESPGEHPHRLSDAEFALFTTDKPVFSVSLGDTAFGTQPCTRVNEAEPVLALDSTMKLTNDTSDSS